MSLKLPKFISLIDEGISAELSNRIARCAINVPTEDGLWWSLTLSLLYPIRNKKKFVYRLKKLIKFCYHPELVSRTAQKDINRLFCFLKKHNPFLDRQSCFNNTFLKNLLEAYKERHVRDQQDLFTALQVACQLVECNIIFCDLPPSEGIKVLYSCEGKNLSVQILTIYFERQKTNSQSLFYFGIKGEILQEKALIIILKTANFREDWIRKIKYTLSFDKNIPLNLVRNELYEAIKLLYKQKYILIKLEEAGFVVDPFAPGINDKSAFSIATIQKNARAVVYVFYIYLSSAERNYGSEKMKRLSITFNALQTSKTAGPNSEETMSFIEQLLIFNNFQTDIGRKFREIHTHFSGTTNYISMEGKNKVSRKKAKLIATLSTYLDYFHFRRNTSITGIDKKANKKVEVLSDLIHFDKYVTYFEILDLNAALLLFDNLFFVKDRVNHSDLDLRAYEEVETQYLSFLFTCEVYGFSQLLYPNSTENEGTKRPHSSLIHNSLRYNVFFERTKLFHALVRFKAQITKAPTILETIPEKRTGVFDILTSVPSIKDVITLRTLLRYINNVFSLVTNAAERKNEEIDVLVTERLLHVLGESLTIGPVKNVTLGKLFLISSFVPQVRTEFCKIRNTMVHIKQGKNAQNRLNVEGSMEIVENVKIVLKDFKLQCEEFLEIMELQMTLDILCNSQSKRLKVFKSCHKVAKMGHKLSDHLVDEFTEEEEKVKALSDIQNQIKRIIYVERNKKPEIIESIRFQLQNHKFFSDRCKTHLEVLIAGIEHYMHTAREKSSHFMDSVVFHIRCIEVLLSYCIKTFKPRGSHFKIELRGILNKMKQAAMNYAKQRNPKNNVLKKSRTDLIKLFSKICEKQSRQADIKSRDAKKFSNILKFGRTLRHFYPLSEAQKNTILGSIPRKFVNHSVARQKLSLMNEQLSKGQPVSISAVMPEINLLLPSREKNDLQFFCKKNRLGKLYIANKIKDPFGTLKKSLENDELIARSHYYDCCSKFGWKKWKKGGTVASQLLQRVISGDPFNTRPVFMREQKYVHLSFLNKKITSLENLLIKSDPIISKMWYQEEDPNEKEQAQFLIVQKFLNSKTFQAAAEMLLLDIFSIQGISRDVEDLWIKASNLFSGINLRNVLAHQNPLIEELGNMLDPDDLATEIVSKCLKMVENTNRIENKKKLLQNECLKMVEN